MIWMENTQSGIGAGAGVGCRRNTHDVVETEESAGGRDLIRFFADKRVGEELSFSNKKIKREEGFRIHS